MGVPKGVLPQSGTGLTMNTENTPTPPRWEISQRKPWQQNSSAAVPFSRGVTFLVFSFDGIGQSNGDMPIAWHTANRLATSLLLPRRLVFAIRFKDVDIQQFVQLLSIMKQLFVEQFFRQFRVE